LEERINLKIPVYLERRCTMSSKCKVVEFVQKGDLFTLGYERLYVVIGVVNLRNNFLGNGTIIVVRSVSFGHQRRFSLEHFLKDFKRVSKKSITF